MKMYRPKVNRDANHKEITDAIKGLGCTVLDLASVGGGCPDILVGIQGKTGTYNILLEIKSAKGKLRPDQETFMQAWRGKVAIVRSREEAVYICNEYKKK